MVFRDMGIFGFFKKINVRTKLILGVRNGESGKFDKALKYFDKALEIDPNCLTVIEFKRVLFEKFKK